MRWEFPAEIRARLGHRNTYTPEETLEQLALRAGDALRHLREQSAGAETA